VDRVRAGRSARAARVVALLSTALLPAGLAGCSGDIKGEGAEIGVTAEALTWSDSGTTINVEAQVEDALCNGDLGQLGVTGQFTSNQAVTIAMLVSIDGTVDQVIAVATPANFMAMGRNFVASFGTDADVPNGMHRIDLCFAKVTASGVSSIRACLPSVNTTLECPDDPPPPTDMVAPSIVGSANPDANAAGWNNSDVLVSFVCTDADSGVASCTAPTTLSTEGAGQSVTGTAVDNAGNTSSTTVSDINIDKTAPTITASRSVEPNAAGWNNTPVTVSFACDDALSGVASCSADHTISTEGADQSASGNAVDAADNMASATVSGINIDMTAPELSVAGGGMFGVDEDVNATCSATDALSGVASTSCGSVSGPAYLLGVGTVDLAATATDNAGNVAVGTVGVTITVDGDSLCNLVERFASHPIHAKAACTLLHSAQADIDRGFNLGARLKLFAFNLLVSVLKGIAFSSDEVAILKNLAAEMM